MDKYLLVFRGGLPNGCNSAFFESLIADIELQDHIFVCDTKSQSIEIVAATEIRSFINLIQGKLGLSVIKSHVGFGAPQHVICFGKLGDGLVTQHVASQAKGLFK